MQYRQGQQERYEREGLLRKNYLNKTRAVLRLQDMEWAVRRYLFWLSLPVIRKKGTVNKHIKEWNEKWFPKQNVVTQKSDNENIMPDFLN